MKTTIRSKIKLTIECVCVCVCVCVCYRERERDMYISMFDLNVKDGTVKLEDSVDAVLGGIVGESSHVY